MYLNRKTIKLSTLKNKIANSQLDSPTTHNLAGSEKRIRPEAEVVSYPVLNYFIAAALLAFFIYLIYSVNGGKQSIPGLNRQQWWQYLIAVIPLILCILLLLLSSKQTVDVHRQRIEFCKYILLGFYKKQSIERDLHELISLSILKKGYERITMTTSSYFVVFNFRPFQEIEALQCSSQITAASYLQQLKAAIPHLRGTLGRISIKNIVET